MTRCLALRGSFRFFLRPKTNQPETEPRGERERRSGPRIWRACPSPPRYPGRSPKECSS
jgi:hypothetical protein